MFVPFSLQGFVLAASPCHQALVAFAPVRTGAPLSFRPVRAIPRISSRGVLCGAIYRVASSDGLQGAGAFYGV